MDVTILFTQNPSWLLISIKKILSVQIVGEDSLTLLEIMVKDWKVYRTTVVFVKKCFRTMMNIINTILPQVIFTSSHNDVFCKNNVGSL